MKIGPFLTFSLIASARGVQPRQTHRQDNVVEREVTNPIFGGTMADSTPVPPPPFQESVAFELNMARIYLNEKKIPLSISYFEQAAVKGSAEAKAELGKIYYDKYNENKVEENLNKSFDYFQQAANQGLKKAQFNCGIMHELGQGTAKNLSEALRWYTKAGNQGHKSAQFNCGLMHYNGEGTDKNLKKAFEWFKKAANQEEKNAQFRLGEMYEAGIYVEKDLNKAVSFYHQSHTNGYAEATKKLQALYKGQRTVDINRYIFSAGFNIVVPIGFFIWIYMIKSEANKEKSRCRQEIQYLRNLGASLHAAYMKEKELSRQTDKEKSEVIDKFEDLKEKESEILKVNKRLESVYKEVAVLNQQISDLNQDVDRKIEEKDKIQHEMWKVKCDLRKLSATSFSEKIIDLAINYSLRRIGNKLMILELHECGFLMGQSSEEYGVVEDQLSFEKFEMESAKCVVYQTKSEDIESVGADGFQYPDGISYIQNNQRVIYFAASEEHAKDLITHIDGFQVIKEGSNRLSFEKKILPVIDCIFQEYGDQALTYHQFIDCSELWSVLKDSLIQNVNRLINGLVKNPAKKKELTNIRNLIIHPTFSSIMYGYQVNALVKLNDQFNQVSAYGKQKLEANFFNQEVTDYVTSITGGLICQMKTTPKRDDLLKNISLFKFKCESYVIQNRIGLGETKKKLTRQLLFEAFELSRCFDRLPSADKSKLEKELEFLSIFKQDRASLDAQTRNRAAHEELGVIDDEHIRIFCERLTKYYCHETPSDMPDCLQGASGGGAAASEEEGGNNSPNDFTFGFGIE
ncbi:MAG: hypothetical protein VXX85_07815 [Candidatus Margulisiibacteriota bacterium]|nr:hypothetical protein [Candidatus Margulisiibacteriota bacterium]